MHIDIDDGMANAHDGIVAQMTDVTWFGGGEVNLKSETIDFSAKPKPRKGLGISVAKLAGMVHVGGSLANPRIQLNPTDAAKQYGEYYLTVASDGLWLLVKGLWDKSQANSEACAEMLETAKDEKNARSNTDQGDGPATLGNSELAADGDAKAVAGSRGHGNGNTQPDILGNE